MHCTVFTVWLSTSILTNFPVDRRRRTGNGGHFERQRRGGQHRRSRRRRRRRSESEQEASKEPDDVHDVPASSARASVRQVTLSRRLQSRGARRQDWTAGSSRTGQVKVSACNALLHVRKKHKLSLRVSVGSRWK